MAGDRINEATSLMVLQERVTIVSCQRIALQD